jgi:replicative DNA helicase
LDEIATADIAPTLRAVSLGEAGRRAYSAAVDASNGAPTRGIPTGLAGLDATIGSLERGQGSILAARPSMGKTLLALQIAMNAAQAAHGVVYFSHEMGDIPLAQRALVAVMFDDASGGDPVAYSRIARGRLSGLGIERLDRASAALDAYPLRIEPQPGLSVSQIAARTRQAKKLFEASGTELGLIVVDHIGLVGASSRYAGDRVREIGEISGALHAVAREHDVHVLMLCQLSRAIESRADKRPQLHDLRESGEIEQNADLVMGVYREAYYLERSGSPEDALRLPDFENVAEIGVLKNRQGPTGTVNLFVDLAANAARNARFAAPRSYSARRG